MSGHKRSGGVGRRGALACVLSILVLGTLGIAAASLDVGGKKDIKVYQANGYVGAFVEAPLLLDPGDPNYQLQLLQSVSKVYTDIVASDPPKRMAGLAEEIARQRPDIAGLEELYTVSIAPDVGQVPGTQPGEFSVVYDYLQLLTQALAAKGAHYEIAVVSTESDIAMPLVVSLQPFILAWGRVVDHEAILVRSDLPPGYLKVSNPQTGRFSIYPQVALGSTTISIYRGWCSVDVFARGERFRVVCTHPQDESTPEIQGAEVAELLNDLADVQMPVMILGDLNSDPLNRNGTESYGDFAKAGFRDAWAALNPNDPAGGLTWGHDPALSDPATPFVYRLDYVFYRGGIFKPTAFEILDPMIGSTAPLWPSDHKAITATFSLDPKPIKPAKPVRAK